MVVAAAEQAFSAEPSALRKQPDGIVKEKPDRQGKAREGEAGKAGKERREGKGREGKGKKRQARQAGRQAGRQARQGRAGRQPTGQPGSQARRRGRQRGGRGAVGTLMVAGAWRTAVQYSWNQQTVTTATVTADCFKTCTKRY